MNRLGSFIAGWCGSFLLLREFFWAIGLPIMPLITKTAIAGFVATFLLSTITAWFLTRLRTATN